MAEVVVHSRSRTASSAGAIYLLLFPIPIVCFLAALLTDIAYSKSAFLMWLHFSEWLNASGLVFGALAALVLLVEFIANPAIRAVPLGWAHLILFYATLVVEFFNALVHTQDGWTAVVPTGLTLSVVGALLALGAVATLFRAPITWVEFRRVTP
jgi:uncharacterized membrane protein